MIVSVYLMQLCRHCLLHNTETHGGKRHKWENYFYNICSSRPTHHVMSRCRRLGSQRVRQCIQKDPCDALANISWPITCVNIQWRTYKCIRANCTCALQSRRINHDMAETIGAAACACPWYCMASSVVLTGVHCWTSDCRWWLMAVITSPSYNSFWVRRRMSSSARERVRGCSAPAGIRVFSASLQQ